MTDCLVVGAGIAGAAAALALSTRYSVRLVDAKGPAAGATGIAAGLVNPFMGHRARPVWQMDEALEAFHRLIDRTGAHDVRDDRGILRPAKDARQADHFQETQQAFPAATDWLSAADAKTQFPAVLAPHGMLHVRTGCAVDAAALTNRVVETARQAGVETFWGMRVKEVQESTTGIAVTVEGTAGREIWQVKHVLWCIGAAYPNVEALASLNVHQVKGQVITLAWPDEVHPDLLPVAGQGYLVPQRGGIVVGSTFDHVFDGLAPTQEATQVLLQKAGRLIEGLGGSLKPSFPPTPS